MPEPEPSLDARPADNSNRTGSGTHNTMSGTVAGGMVQAGVVCGGIHLHLPLLPASVVPRQLPVSHGMFAGRVAELAELDRTLNACSQDGRPSAKSPTVPGIGFATSSAAGAVVVSTIVGAGGIGKTWLALEWANRNLDHFPEGQLFVDLRGFGPAGKPMPAKDAVRGFLHGLGVAPDHVPNDLDDQCNLYRSLVAGRRMLIVLDNAASSEQVIPLLPGGSSCTVLVTSRKRSVELITRHSARPLHLGILTDTETHALLAARLGPARVAAEKQAVTELVRLCRGFPLALGVIAARADSQPHLPLSEIVAELGEIGLDALHTDDPTVNVAIVVSWSLRQLTHEQRTLFVLLGIAPGLDIGLPAAAALTGRSLPRTRRALQALEDASLLSRQAQDRYSMHDLIRDCAATTARRGLIKLGRKRALRRIVDFYLATSYTAHHLLSPWVAPLWLDVHAPTFLARSHPLADVQAALAWLDTEHTNLMAALHTATVYRWHNRAWLLSLALEPFQERRGHHNDALVAAQAAMNAIKHLNDPGGRRITRLLLGHAYSQLDQHEKATGHLRLALTSAKRFHDTYDQARAHHLLAESLARRDEHQQALAHAERALTLYHSRHSLIRRYRAHEDPIGLAKTLNLVGRYAATNRRNHDIAHAHCEEALTLYRRHRHSDGEASTLDSLGLIDHHAGHHLKAINHYRESLTLLRDYGDTYTAADTLDRLGHPHTALEQHDEARAA